MLEDLYKIKIIRDFLRLFSEHKWKSLITNVLQLGILHLKTHHQLNNLSLDEIIDILEKQRDKQMNENNKNKETPPNRSHSVTKTPNTKNHNYTIKQPGTHLKPDNSSKHQLRKSKSRPNTNMNVEQMHTHNENNSVKSSIYTNSLNSEIYPNWWGEKKKKMPSKHKDKEKHNISKYTNEEREKEFKNQSEYYPKKSDFIDPAADNHNHHNNQIPQHRQQSDNRYRQTQADNDNTPIKHNNYDKSEMVMQKQKKKEKIKNLNKLRSEQEYFIPKHTKNNYYNNNTSTSKIITNNNFDHIEAKILGDVENDKRLYRLLVKDNNYDDWRVQKVGEEPEPVSQQKREKFIETEWQFDDFIQQDEKKKHQNKHKTGGKREHTDTNYLISYDKKLIPHRVREQSYSRSRSKGKMRRPSSYSSNEEKTEVNNKYQSSKQEDLKSSDVIKENTIKSPRKNMTESNEVRNETVQSQKPENTIKSTSMNMFESNEIRNETVLNQRPENRNHSRYVSINQTKNDLSLEDEDEEKKLNRFTKTFTQADLDKKHKNSPHRSQMNYSLRGTPNRTKDFTHSNFNQSSLEKLDRKIKSRNSPSHQDKQRHVNTNQIQSNHQNKGNTNTKQIQNISSPFNDNNKSLHSYKPSAHDSIKEKEKSIKENIHIKDNKQNNKEDNGYYRNNMKVLGMTNEIRKTPKFSAEKIDGKNTPPFNEINYDKESHTDSPTMVFKKNSKILDGLSKNLSSKNLLNTQSELLSSYEPSERTKQYFGNAVHSPSSGNSMEY